MKRKERRRTTAGNGRSTGPTGTTVKKRTRQGPTPDQPQRLNRMIAASGLTSRRKADEWIASGRVTVNGQPVTELGTRVVPSVDTVMVDGRTINLSAERIYLILNKPFGYMCTLHDPEGRPVVTDLLPGVSERVYPVGRLDFDTMGLLLLTNDGEWAFRLTHPGYEVPRTYKATVTGFITDEALRALTEGVLLDDGPSGPSKAQIIRRTDRQSIVRITIRQGRSRQVRRMFDTVGFPAVHLVRTGFSTLTLGELKPGEYRYLETVEVKEVSATVGLA